MENLNDLIWTDEDENSTQSLEGPPMAKLCMVAFCDIIYPGPPSIGGTLEPVGLGGISCGMD